MISRRIFFMAALLVVVCACSRRQAGLSEYHEALALMDRGDAPAALRRLQRASEMAHSDSLRALVYSQMGTLYFNQRLLDRSLESYRQAYAVDQRAQDTLGLIYDLRDMGNVLRATEGSEDSCVAYLAEARQLAIATGNTLMQRDVESQLAGYYLYRNRLDEARQLLLPALACLDERNQSGLLFMMADYYHRSGQHDSAAFYCQRLLQCGNLYTRQAAHRMLAGYCMADGQAAEAMEHLRQYELLTDSVHRENDAEGMRRTAALYDYTLREQRAARLQGRLVVAIASVLLLVLLLTVLLLYFSRRRMHYRLKVERLEQLLEKYRQRQLLASADADAQTNDRINGRENCSSDGQSMFKDTAIAKQIDRFLSDAHQQAMGDTDFHQLDDTIEACYPGFLRHLQEFCRLTPQERRVCLLLKAGITPAAIAQLTAHSRQSVANTRSRLFKKAFGKSGSPSEWDEFIQSL